ncbi:unnamed protein product [Urochloa decumbens]|uniref:Uncharacterized protein n=1 Tax=Urochloa decumbens TaxID=240449 RepID=A0ABC9ALM4_9POAL
MDSSSVETQDTWSVSNMMALPLLPAVDVDEEDIMSALQIPTNIQEPKMKGPGPLAAIPLSMVLIPYGRNEPIPFDQKVIDNLREKSAPVKEQSVLEGKQEVGMPQSLKSLHCYKEEDWKAFIKTRADGQHKDWSYEHRLYRRDFRSTVEVEDFLKSDGPTTGMFRGRKLQKKVGNFSETYSTKLNKIPGWDSHGSFGMCPSTIHISNVLYLRD